MINTNSTRYDVIIVGGGMVGATAALALASQGKSVALIEKMLPQQSWLAQPPLRVSAINLFSEAYLTELGLWSHVEPRTRCVFNYLSTWEAGTEAVTFSAEEIGQSHLGHLVRNEALQIAAYNAIQQTVPEKVDVIGHSKLVAIENGRSSVTLTLEQEDRDQITLEGAILIGADGANSQVRRLAGIGISGWDYQQHCLSITIKTDFPTQDITWQQFQPTGPKAFLPLSEGYASLIWYDAPETIKQLKANGNLLEVKQRILDIFPPLAGDFEVVQLASFPLTRRQANDYYQNRVVLCGDAAHTINPLAGQGVNLGYKDVACLVGLLQNSDLTNYDAVQKALAKYQFKRKLDSKVMSGAMDSFYLLFSNQSSALKQARKGLLSVANKLPWAKKQVLKKAVGY